MPMKTKCIGLSGLLAAGSLAMAVALFAPPAAFAQVPGASGPGEGRPTLGSLSPQASSASVTTESASASSGATGAPVTDSHIVPPKILGSTSSGTTATVAGPVTQPQIPPPGDTGMKPNAKDMPLE